MSKLAIINFVNALFLVYEILIIVRIVFSWIGLPSRGLWYEVYRFVFNVTEPYLGLFRRIIPLAGPIDFSPFIGMLLLGILNRVVVQIIAGA